MVPFFGVDFGFVLGEAVFCRFDGLAVGDVEGVEVGPDFGLDVELILGEAVSRFFLADWQSVTWMGLS